MVEQAKGVVIRDGWHVDLRRIVGPEIQAFRAALRKSTNEPEGMYKWFAKTILAWPFEGKSPADLEVYGTLNFVELLEMESVWQSAMPSFRGADLGAN
jgi:hypothetical protein